MPRRNPLSSQDDPPAEPEQRSGAAWFLRGTAKIASVPALALAGGYIGYGALVHDFGWPLWAALLSTLVIWANPAQVVLAGALAAGASLAAASLAVTLSAVRLLPMVVAVLPVLRSGRTPLLFRLLAAHFTAVTVWVEGMRTAPALPRPARMPYYLGIGCALSLTSVGYTGLGFLLAGTLPTVLALALLAITPLYFLLSLERGARSVGERLALVIGLALAPEIAQLAPGFDLLLTGLIAGTVAFLIERALQRRRAPS